MGVVSSGSGREQQCERNRQGSRAGQEDSPRDMFGCVASRCRVTWQGVHVFYGSDPHPLFVDHKRLKTDNGLSKIVTSLSVRGLLNLFPWVCAKTDLIFLQCLT